MNKKFILSVFGYVIATMIVAYPWHEVIFFEKYVALGAITRENPIIPLGVLTMFLQGVVFAYFYPLFYRHVGGGHPVVKGIQFCLFMGLTVWSVMVLATAAKFRIEPIFDFLILGTTFQIVQYILVGAVIGLIYGRNP